MKIVLILVIAVCLAVAEDSPVGINRGWTVRSTGIGGRITNGKDAVAGQHPYQVSFQRLLFDKVFTHICGGVIISPTFVLTAGHCILPQNTTYRVVVGILNLNDAGGSRQDINIVQRIVHPNYKREVRGGVGPHDIGVLKLASAIKFGPGVQPLRLPKSGAVPAGSAVLSGWGSISNTTKTVMPIRLQTLNVPIVPILQCRDALDTFLKRFNVTNPLDIQANVCTGPLFGGFASCAGDSGGPLAQNGTVLGVVSWGATPCGSPGAPSVLTKVENYLDFIKLHVPDLPAY